MYDRYKCKTYCGTGIYRSFLLITSVTSKYPDTFSAIEFSCDFPSEGTTDDGTVLII